jgi:Zn finger protein HypA/HybF involved in hydrogenase expression
MNLAKKLMDLIEIKTDEAEKTPMVCHECGHKFKKTVGKGTVEVKCPKCGGYDTEID